MMLRLFFFPFPACNLYTLLAPRRILCKLSRWGIEILAGYGKESFTTTMCPFLLAEMQLQMQLKSIRKERL